MNDCGLIYGGTRYLTMAKCCVCDEEGVVLARGFWWCQEHYDIVGDQLEKADTSELENIEKEKSSSVDLDLEWV